MNSERHGHGPQRPVWASGPETLLRPTRPPWDAGLATVMPQACTNARGVRHAHLAPTRTEPSPAPTAWLGPCGGHGTGPGARAPGCATPTVCLSSGFATRGVCVPPAEPATAVTGALSSPPAVHPQARPVRGEACPEYSPTP